MIISCPDRSFKIKVGIDMASHFFVLNKSKLYDG